MKKQVTQKESGYVLVMVMGLLLVLTALGMGALVMAGSEVESSAFDVQRTGARFCADQAMATMLSKFADSSSMLNDYVTVSATDNHGTMELPVDQSGNTATYTYWLGHFGQKNEPQEIVYAASTAQIEALAALNSAGASLTNQLTPGGGGATSVTKYYSFVVTCAAPSGAEVEVQSLLKRGI